MAACPSPSRGVGDLDVDLQTALSDMLSVRRETLAPQHCGAIDGLEFTLCPLDMPVLLAMYESQSPSLREKQFACEQTLASIPALAAQEQATQQQLSTRRGKDERNPSLSKPNRRHRKRPKHELDSLRTMVAYLEEELATLSQLDVQSPEVASIDHWNERIVPEATETELKTPSRWRQIAHRQKTEADTAVAENRALRTRLQGQLQVAQILEAAIDQHQREAAQALPWQRVEAQLAWIGVTSGNRPRAMNASDELVFEQLNASLEGQFTEVDALLTASGLAHVHRDLQSGIQFQREDSGISFRHEEARLLPFTMRATHHALWSCLRDGATHEALGRFHSCVVNKDLLNVTMQDTTQSSKASCISVTRRFAMRRLFEQDRVVVVWSGVVEIDSSIVVRLRENGWSTASRFAFHRGVEAGADSASSSVEGCITRMTVRVKPELAESYSDKETRRHVGEMTDVVVGSYHHHFGLLHRIMENLLLSDATAEEETEAGWRSLMACVNPNWPRERMLALLALRATLQDQLEVARSLQTAMDQLQKERAQTLPWLQAEFALGRTGTASVSKNGGLSCGTPMADEQLFAHLKSSLQAEVDEILGACGLDRVHRDLQHATHIQQDAGGLSFRHAEVRLLPFSMRAVHRAMWSTMRYDTAKTMMSPFQTRVVDNNQMNVTLNDTLQLPQSRYITVARRMALRRYFEPGRVVVVWSAHLEIQGTISLRLREKGYCSTEASDVRCGANATTKSRWAELGCSSRMTVVARPEMIEFDADQDSRQHVGDMTSLLVDMYQQNFGFMHQIVENLLLGDAIGGAAAEEEGEYWPL